MAGTARCFVYTPALLNPTDFISLQLPLSRGLLHYLYASAVATFHRQMAMLSDITACPWSPSLQVLSLDSQGHREVPCSSHEAHLEVTAPFRTKTDTRAARPQVTMPYSTKQVAQGGRHLLQNTASNSGPSCQTLKGPLETAAQVACPP